jgi:hypothetical protein
MLDLLSNVWSRASRRCRSAEETLMPRSATTRISMRLTLGRAALLVVLVQWLLEWLGRDHPPVSAVGYWGIVAARGSAYAALGALALGRGRRWTAPLVSLGAALAASLAVCVVGIVTGQFLARGLGPAYVLAVLV